MHSTARLSARPRVPGKAGTNEEDDVTRRARLSSAAWCLTAAVALSAPDAQNHFLAVDGTTKLAAGDGSTAKPFATIGAAFEAAQPGDTIKVARGTYAEALRANKSLHLVGGFKGNGDFESSDRGASPTIIRGTGTNTVLEFRGASWLSIVGFNITGGIRGLDLIGCSNITVSNRQWPR